MQNNEDLQSNEIYTDNAIRSLAFGFKELTQTDIDNAKKKNPKKSTKECLIKDSDFSLWKNKSKRKY